MTPLSRRHSPPVSLHYLLSVVVVAIFFPSPTSSWRWCEWSPVSPCSPIEPGIEPGPEQLLGKDGNSALVWAVREGHAETVRALLVRGANASDFTYGGETPLGLACWIGRADIVRDLLELGGNVSLERGTMIVDRYDERGTILEGPDVDAEDARNATRPPYEPWNIEGDSPLKLAATNCRLEIIQILLEAGARVNAKNRFGETALMIAAHHGCVKVCEALLEGGALIGEGDDTDDTALMYAAREGKTATVAVLLRATDKAGREGTTGRGGWGIAVKNTGMQSAYHFAAFHGHINVLRQLHAYAMVSGSGRVPGHSSGDNRELRRTTYTTQIAELTVAKAAAVEAEEYEEAQRVKDKIDELKKKLKRMELEKRNAGGDDIEHRIDVDAADEKGMNMLMLAAFKGQSNMVKFLLQNRASVDVFQDRGYTPLLLAAKQGHTRVALFLISAGANIHHRNIYGDTALGCAAWEGHMWTVDALLRRGADPYVTNTYKLSPLLQVRIYRCERGGGR